MSKNEEKEDPFEEGGKNDPNEGRQKSHLDRLEALKKRRSQSEKQNKKAAYQEENQRRFRSQTKDNLSENDDQAWRNRRSQESGTSNTENSARERNWNWSIEDCEKWDQKQRSRRNTQKLASGFQNYTALAERAYAKEICNRPTDMEEYQRQKKAWSDPTMLENKPFKPNPVDVDTLALSTNESVNRKRQRRNHESSSIDGYINDKNKHFNQKLARESHKLGENLDKKKEP